MMRDSRLVLKGTKKGILYCLQRKALLDKFVVVKVDSHLDLWHEWLGYRSEKRLNIFCSLENYAKGTKLGINSWAKCTKLEFVMIVNVKNKHEFLLLSYVL